MRPTFVSEDDFAAMEKRVRGAQRVEATTGSRSGGDGKRHRPSGADNRLNKLPLSHYRSKLEANFASKLELEKRAGCIKAYAYEDHTMKLAKGKYHRPDFLIWHLDGSIEIAQVKGWHRNIRAGMTGLKWAAQQRPWFKFTLNKLTGTGWESSHV